MTDREKKKHGRFWPIFGRVIIIFIAVLVVFGLIYRKEIGRLYHVITLFEPGVIVSNFRNMDTMFDYRTVHRGETVFGLTDEKRALPDTYVYEGEVKSTAKFIDETWTTGLIVLKGDTVAFEEYYLGNDRGSKAISWSVAKSFVSALVGIAVDEGYIKDIKDPVTRYVPSLKGTGYDGVPIKDVLEMSSGIRFNEDYADFHSDINRMGRVIALSGSLDSFVASLKNERKPGTYNHYVSMNTQVLGMVLREATGRDISSYLEEKIWKKIGMESDAYWLIDGAGMELAFGGLNVVLRDYARFGLLYLNGGKMMGQQIVPEDWVSASVNPTAPYLLPGKRDSSDWVLGYGYQWWIPENPQGDFLAIGIYNQFIYVSPKYNVVIAKTSAYADYDVDGEAKELESIAFFRAIAESMQ
jgi:CubicO group peptidase (beta-lactamase class C family)